MELSKSEDVSVFVPVQNLNTLPTTTVSPELELPASNLNPDSLTTTPIPHETDGLKNDESGDVCSDKGKC